MKKAMILLLAFLLLLPVPAMPEEAAVTAEPVPVRDEEAVREYADRLRDRFGITILTGDECAGAAKTSGFTLESGSPEGNLPAALQQLEEALGRYREGFFSLLQDRNHPNGLRILLADRITDSNPARRLPAYTDAVSEWYDICLESGQFGGMDVHYGIWLVLEKAIRARFPYAFSDWTLLNPADFVYSFDYAADTDGYNELYFARGSGTVSQEEDRASIFEATFYDNFEEWVAGKTGILYKMQYMNTFIELLAKEAAEE